MGEKRIRHETGEYRQTFTHKISCGGKRNMRVTWQGEAPRAQKIMDARYDDWIRYEERE